MDKAITALIEAHWGLRCTNRRSAAACRARWPDGPLGYLGAAVAGALIALVVRYALRKEFGWP